jgi:hypothetical protein
MPAHLILFYLITLIILAEDKKNGAPHYPIFSSLLSLHPSLSQSLKHTVLTHPKSVSFPSKSQINLHIHTKQQIKLRFLNLLIFRFFNSRLNVERL